MRISFPIVATLMLASVTLAQPAAAPARAKPRLGVKLIPDDQPGVLISDVMVGYAADTAGLRAGDRVVKIDGAAIERVDDFRIAVSNLGAGASADFTVKRDGAEQIVKVTMAPPRDDAPGASLPTMPQLQEELLAMLEKDQAPRKVIMQDQPPPEAMEKLTHDLHEIDAANRERLKQVIAEHGYPTITMVGEEGAGAAFLIVQHADADPQWQASMLPVLEALAKKGEASNGDVAYLTDRVLRAPKKPQLYGTQYFQEPGPAGKPRYVAPVVEDPANIDKRRLSMGLGPWAQYEAQMAKMQQREIFAAPRGPDDR